MTPYWITLADGRVGCAVVSVSELLTDEQVKNLPIDQWVGEQLGSQVVNMKTLPYAASPLLLGSDMTLCYSPTECAGRTSCPKRRSCCD